MESSEPKTLYVPGMTLRSFAACIFAMLVMGMYIQYAEVLLVDNTAPAEQALPVPAMVVFLGLLVVCGLIYAAARRALLTRQELLCVLFTMLISAPMMTQGMWHRFIGLVSSPPRTSSFAYLDAYNDNLWPHGRNLVQDAFTEKAKDDLIWRGSPPIWKKMEFEKGKTAALPILENEEAGDLSSVTIKIPLSRDGRDWLRRGEPYLISFLIQPRNLAAESKYFARVYNDQDEEFTEIISSREAATKTFIHQTSFMRIGSYGHKFSTSAENYIRVELGLDGVGELAVYDPKVLSVAALEGVYNGRPIVLESVYEKLPPEDRANLIVKPDRMWSIAGLKFLLSGYIPVADWLRTAVAWSIFIGLLLLGTLTVNVLMRRQWAESERFPFPMFQIPDALLGSAEESQAGFARVYRNRFFWSGFAMVAAIGTLRLWNKYDNTVPVPAIFLDHNLRDLFSSPTLQATFAVTFSVFLVIVAFAMFFELNVLFSLVLGYLIYRILWGVGAAYQVTDPGYPFRYEQAIGGYIGYALVVLFFTHKYFARVFRAIFRNDKSAWAGEVFSYRTAAILMILIYIGLAAWAAWLGVSVLAIGIFFTFLLLIGFVASRFRAECGIPMPYFSPYNAMLLVALIGGMKLFGASGMLVCLVASGFITVACFYFIPGAQMELLEYGRRHRVVPRHLLYTVALGILGGLFIGGWVFLSNSYAIGGQNIKYQWAYSQDWFFGSYKTELAKTTTEMLAVEQGKTITDAPIPLSYWFYGGSAGLAILLSCLRQVFAGFWFHPIGLILGSSHMMDGAWGSVLVALVLRFLVLRLGGAATVKNKLMPFAVGMFVAGMIVMFLGTCYATYLRHLGIEQVYFVMP